MRKWVITAISIVTLSLLLGLIICIYRAIQSSKPDVLIDGLIGGLAGALVGILVAIVAWVQLNNISQTGSADFILRLKQDFFTAETRTLFQLIDRGWLKFVEKGQDLFFHIDLDEIGKSEELTDDVKEALRGRKIYSAYDMDDLLLGHFEDLGTLREKGVLDLGMVYDMFSYYVEAAWENREIQKYIKAERKNEGDNSIYERFEALYQECHKRSHPEGAVRTVSSA